jgi:hypothetical protein
MRQWFDSMVVPSANTGHVVNGDDKAFIDRNRLGL